MDAVWVVLCVQMKGVSVASGKTQNVPEKEMNVSCSA